MPSDVILVTLEWKKIKQRGYKPSPRVYHTTVCLDSIVYMFGGKDPNNINKEKKNRANINELLAQRLWLCYLDALPQGTSKIQRSIGDYIVKDQCQNLYEVVYNKEMLIGRTVPPQFWSDL
jgi:hypothetical protein